MRSNLHSRTLPLLTAVAAAFCIPGLVCAQKVAGQWEVRYQREAVIIHGPDSASAREVTAMLTLRLQGDSVFGQWQPVVATGESPAPVGDIRGVARGDSAVVRLFPAVDADAGVIQTFANDVLVFLRTHVHGMPPMQTFLEFRVRGDSLVGVRRTVSEDGAVKTANRELTGVRMKP